MARAARYCTKTMGALLVNSMGCRMQVENIIDPAGETQTLEPRPRPATWTVAEAVKPVGRWRSSLVFLLRFVSERFQMILAGKAVHILLKHSVRARDHFAIQKMFAEYSIGLL